MLKINSASFQIYFSKTKDDAIELYDTYSNKEGIEHSELAAVKSTFLDLISKEVKAHGDIELLVDTKNNCVVLNHIYMPYMYLFPICAATSFEKCSSNLVSSLKTFAAAFEKNQQLIEQSNEFKGFEDLKKAVFAYSKFRIPFQLFITKEFVFLSVFDRQLTFRVPFLKDTLIKYGIKPEIIPNGKIFAIVHHWSIRSSIQFQSDIIVNKLIMFPKTMTFKIQKTRNSEVVAALQQLKKFSYEGLCDGDDYKEFVRILEEHAHSSLFHDIMGVFYLLSNIAASK